LDLKRLNSRVSDKDLNSFVVNYLGVETEIGFKKKQFEKIVAFIKLKVDIKGLGYPKG